MYLFMRWWSSQLKCHRMPSCSTYSNVFLDNRICNICLSLIIRYSYYSRLSEYLPDLTDCYYANSLLKWRLGFLRLLHERGLIKRDNVDPIMPINDTHLANTVLGMGAEIIAETQYKCHKGKVVSPRPFIQRITHGNKIDSPFSTAFSFMKILLIWFKFNRDPINNKNMW